MSDYEVGVRCPHWYDIGDGDKGVCDKEAGHEGVHTGRGTFFGVPIAARVYWSTGEEWDRSE